MLLLLLLLLGVLAAVGARTATADIPTNLADFYRLTLHDGYDVYWRFVVDDYNKYGNLSVPVQKKGHYPGPLTPPPVAPLHALLS